MSARSCAEAGLCCVLLIYGCEQPLEACIACPR